MFLIILLTILQAFAFADSESQPVCSNPVPEQPFCDSATKLWRHGQPLPKSLNEIQAMCARGQECFNTLTKEAGVTMKFGTQASIMLTDKQRKKLIALGSNAAEISKDVEASRLVSAQSIGQGFIEVDEDIKDIILNSVKSPGAQRARMIEAWEDVLQFVEACEMTTSKKFARNSTFRQEALFCSLRLNFDALTPIPLLRQWPGCACKGGAGRLYSVGKRSVCVSGLAAKVPIEGRMPRYMQSFVENLDQWADKNGYVLNEVRAGGCGFDRFAKGGQLSRLRSAKARAEYTKNYVSPHAESRACDLRSASFTPKHCGKKKCEEVRFEIQNNEGCPFARALNDYAREYGLPLRETAFTTDKTVASCGNETYPDLPHGYTDYLKLEEDVKALKKNGRIHKKLSENDWQQLDLGIGVRNSLMDAGFTVVDPVANQKHLDHFHINLASHEQDSAILALPVVDEPEDDRDWLSRRVHEFRDSQRNGREALALCSLQRETTTRPIDCPDEEELALTAK